MVARHHKLVRQSQYEAADSEDIGSIADIEETLWKANRDELSGDQQPGTPVDTKGPLKNHPVDAKGPLKEGDGDASESSEQNSTTTQD